MFLHTTHISSLLVSKNIDSLTATLGFSRRDVEKCFWRRVHGSFFLIIFSILRLTSVPSTVNTPTYYEKHSLLQRKQGTGLEITWVLYQKLVGLRAQVQCVMHLRWKVLAGFSLQDHQLKQFSLKGARTKRYYCKYFSFNNTYCLYSIFHLQSTLWILYLFIFFVAKY